MSVLMIKRGKYFIIMNDKINIIMFYVVNSEMRVLLFLTFTINYIRITSSQPQH